MRNLTEYNLDQMTDIASFNERVVNYCNDNEDFFAFDDGSAEYEGVDVGTQSPSDYAEAALEHWNISADGFGDDQLEGQHAEQFKAVARKLQDQGYVEHAGTLVR